MSNLFDRLEDKTPVTRKQVETSLATATRELGANSASLAEMLAKAISDAIRAVDSKQITVAKDAVREWVFDVEHDANGRTKRITAKAIR